jgi:glycine cleavage system H protein
VEIEQTLKYSENHEWVRVERNLAVIGMTDFAQEELGTIVFVELPEVGDLLKAGEPFGSMESIKTVSEMYAPLSGKVVDINRKLQKDSGAINIAPYEGGWMIVIEVADEAELEQLWDYDKYQDTYIRS